MFADEHAMRTTIAITVGVGVIVGLLFRLMRRKPVDVDAGSVSGQWIAEHSSRSDQSWT